MLREEQIDIRRQRARESNFTIENTGKNRVFSDFRVSNPTTGGQYTVTIRGVEVGENTCTCPDFRSNTLGTCKHIEGVLARLEEEVPRHLLQRKAAVTRTEVVLSYGEQLRIKLHLPPRHSDKLRNLAKSFFDENCYWKEGQSYQELIAGIESVPEEVTVLSDAMDFIDREIERAELHQRERELTAQLNRMEIPALLQNLLRVPLYDFQLRGAIFAACRGRSILGDDMGLGKTVQTMACVEILARERGIRKVLVIAPASVKYQWESEIRRFTGRDVQVIDGSKEERQEQYTQPAFYRLMNYEQVVRDTDSVIAWNPDLIVLDEAQRIKNWESKTSKSVKKLRSRYALVLTGTPLENKLEELYSIVQFVDDRRLGPAFQFLHDHRILDENGALQGYRNLDKIREKLAPILLRRTRAQVLTQLPSRTENTVFVELSIEQKTQYDEQRHALARLLQKSYLTELDRKRILASIVNMRMLCDNTFLFDKTTNHSPKLEEFAELVQELLAAGEHKAVVFSQWEMMLVKAAEVLDKLGVGYAVLHGGIQSRDRRDLLERFKTDGGCRVFLSTDAGGTGLNLQHADTVINLEVPWNPAVLDQRIARVHRMGQERPVRVINLVARNTIEERVLKTLEVKRNLFAGVFDGDTDEVSFQSLGQQSFLDGVRELIGEDVRPTAIVPPPPVPVVEVKPSVVATNPHERLWSAGVQFLEALIAVAKPEHAAELSPELLARGRAAVESLQDLFRNADD